jgi:broad-specificity NMP kinase
MDMKNIFFITGASGVGKTSLVQRFTHDRKQPELFNEDMKNWLQYLRNQAKDFDANSIDTSNKTNSEVLKSFEQIIQKRINQN